MKSINRELKVGIFAAIAIALLYFGFNFLKGSDLLSSTHKYYLVFENVDQLAVSNPVLVNGYAVGRVSRIKIVQEKQNAVLVEIDIDAAIVLGDTTKAILNSDFLGGKSILLVIGSVQNPARPGDTLRTEMARGIVDVLTQTAEPVADNLQTTLRKFNSVLDNLNKNSQRLDVILAGFEKTPAQLNSTLATAQNKITELSADLKLTTTQVNQALGDLRPTLANFREVSDSLKKVELGKALSQTRVALQQLNQTLARLNKGDNTLSKLMTEDSLYVNLNQMIKTFDSLAHHLNSNPKHFFAPLGKSKRKIERDRKKD